MGVERGDLGDVAPAFAGRRRALRGVLSASNYQWFNRLIKDDEPYLGFEFQTNNVSIG